MAFSVYNSRTYQENNTSKSFYRLCHTRSGPPVSSFCLSLPSSSLSLSRFPYLNSSSALSSSTALCLSLLFHFLLSLNIHCSLVESEEERMAVNASSRTFLFVMSIFLLVCTMLFPNVEAQDQAQAPAPAPTSDGTSIDQGIAYILMLLALVLTYLIHPLDASSYSFF